MRTHQILLVTVPSFAAIAGCDAESQRAFEAASSKAKFSIANLKGDHGAGVYNGQPDYGVRLSFTLTNVGDSGAINLTPWISCSEGEWSKNQSLELSAGQSMDLTYLFEQPTINATNHQCNQHSIRSKILT